MTFRHLVQKKSMLFSLPTLLNGRGHSNLYNTFFCQESATLCILAPLESPLVMSFYFWDLSCLILLPSAYFWFSVWTYGRVSFIHFPVDKTCSSFLSLPTFLLLLFIKSCSHLYPFLLLTAVSRLCVITDSHWYTSQVQVLTLVFYSLVGWPPLRCRLQELCGI